MVKTGKDYGLPEQYADWIEVDGSASSLGHGRYLRVSFDENIGAYWANAAVSLPRGQGAVIGFRSTIWGHCRAIRISHDSQLMSVHGKIQPGHLGDLWADGELLALVNNDGFTVELEGL